MILYLVLESTNTPRFLIHGEEGLNWNELQKTKENRGICVKSKSLTVDDRDASSLHDPSPDGSCFRPAQGRAWAPSPSSPYPLIKGH